MVHKPWTKKELIEAHRWRQEGIAVAEVASRLGRSTCAVIHALAYHNARGILPFTRRKRASLRYYRTQVIALHRKGLSDNQVAFALGVRRDTVRVWRGKLGLPANTDHYDWKARYARQMENAGVESLVEMRWNKSTAD
jgi:FixJ family two-component response regulator